MTTKTQIKDSIKQAHESLISKSFFGKGKISKFKGKDRLKLHEL